MQETSQHSICIEQRKNIAINGVESVSAFSEVKIMLTLIGGDKLQVIGSGLKIIGFSKTSGTFTAEGNVSGVQYGGKSFAAKLFR